ncbi:glycosyltransferase [Vibrio tasmaniensis]|uniref:glycosyltransferase n=1 Tax=Vibrio tasmaniensis TaxID=212663 RepID=UPI001118CABE|nr:glycosyltransferase [Vibrio tasmaniensis]
MLPKVCVLCAVYNGEEYLHEQLTSILKQKEVELDIFLSVDKSTDSSLNILKGFERGNSNIIILPYGETYGSAGQNFFRLFRDVDFEDYDYISLSDQDDIWLPDKLITSISEMKKNSSNAYSGNVMAFWENGKTKLIKKNAPQVSYDHLFESSGPGCSFVLDKQLSIAIKNNLIENSLGSKKLWMHDWFIYSFARTQGYKWYIGARPLMLYRQHDANVVGASSGMAARILRAKVILSNSAFTKVIEQANYLDLKAKPIELIKSGKKSDLVKLAFYGHKCRRKANEKLLFSFAILAILVKRVING